MERTAQQIEIAKQELIEATRRSMEATKKCIDSELLYNNDFTEKQYKSMMNQYHDARIRLDILLGLLPPLKEKKSRIKSRLFC